MWSRPEKRGGDSLTAPADDTGETPVSFGAAPAPPARNRHSGGVGAPPGDITIPRQELADVRCGALPARTLALEWAETGKPARGQDPQFAIGAARLPMTRLRLSEAWAQQRKHAKIAAMERRKARRLARGVSTKRCCADRRSISPLFRENERTDMRRGPRAETSGRRSVG